jgi:mono/diheme cytochrome c family protein
MRLNHRFWLRIVWGLLIFVVVIQLVPYGRSHANPVIQTEAKWDNHTTRALFNRACADCHSNRTMWPWYSNVAPISWLLQAHVDGGRKKFNINVKDFGEEAGNAAEVIQNGKMPEPSYLPLHPEARLSDVETAQLIAGVRATFGAEGGILKGVEIVNRPKGYKYESEINN